MKKSVITLLIILFSFVFIPIANAANLEYYENVNVQITFAEDVDTDNIGDIQVNLNDQFGEEYKTTLVKKDGYKGTISNVPIRNLDNNEKYEIVYEYTDIGNDRLGTYDDTSKITINGKNMNVVVNIAYKGTTASDPNATVPEEVLKQINNTTTKTSKTTTSTTTTTEAVVMYDEEGNIILEDNTTTKKNQETTSTTTNSDGLTNEEVNKKKEKTAKKNALITKILFITIGIVVLIAIVVTGVKIAKANK